MNDYKKQWEKVMQPAMLKSASLSDVEKSLDDIFDDMLAEIEQLISINHSVSVCKDHTSEITKYDDCLICRIAELEFEIKKKDAHIKGLKKHCAKVDKAYVQAFKDCEE